MVPVGIERKNASPRRTLPKAKENTYPSVVLAQEILDSLTANVALIDSTGVVMTANAAWKQFANDNRCTDRAHYIGSNYLAICEDAVRLNGDAAAAARFERNSCRSAWEAGRLHARIPLSLPRREAMVPAAGDTTFGARPHGVRGRTREHHT